MIENIRRILELAGADRYIICSSDQRVEERYTAADKIDMKRLTSRTEYKITVYQVYEEEGETYKGDATVKLFPDMTDEEIHARIIQCIQTARSVRIPYYEDPAPSCGFSERDNAPEIDQILSRFLDADKQGNLLYLEIFRESEERRIVTSWGSDVSDRSLSVRGEFAAGDRRSDGAVSTECFMDFTLAEGTDEEICSLVNRAVDLARLRGNCDNSGSAQELHGKFNVILEGRFAHELLSMYLSRADASAVLTGISDYRVGKRAAPADLPDMWMTSEKGFSDDGVPLEEKALLREGVIADLHGQTKDMAMLGLEPSGRYDGLKVCGGYESEEKWKDEAYIRPLLFSDFLMYARTGAFMGEIRLAEFFDGKSIRLFSGGSLHGNLLELQDSLRCSSEMYSENNYTGPAAVKLAGVEVTGGNN